jgi:inner membrane transporter RhtA
MADQGFDWVRATPAAVLGALTQYLGAAMAVTAFAHLEPAATAWLRNCAAALILLAVIRPQLRGLTVARLGAATGLGVSVLVTNAALYEAIARIPLGTASAIEFCGPVLLSTIRARTPRALLAALIAGAGVVCVTGPTGLGTATNRAGLMFAAAAAIAYATKAVSATRVAHSTHHRDDLALGLAASSLLATPLVAAVAPSAGGHALSVPARLIPQVLVIAVCSSVLPYLMDQLVARRVHLDGLALLSGLLPVTAAVLGDLLLHQRLTPTGYLGIGLVCAAITLRATPTG